MINPKSNLGSRHLHLRQVQVKTLICAEKSDDQRFLRESEYEKQTHLQNINFEVSYVRQITHSNIHGKFYGLFRLHRR
jgi:hypothetical protein